MKNKRILQKLLVFMLIISFVFGQYVPSQAAVKKVTYSIKLNKTSYTLNKGKKVNLKATLSKAAKKKGIQWSSSNTKVASVSKSGKVTAKKNGKSTITARVKGTKVKARCKITVKTPVSSVKLNRSAVSLKIGQNYTLKASISPKNASSKAVSYNSSNPNVASVTSKGVIQAVSEGTAVITATANNGVYAACTVRVEKEQTQPEIPEEPEIIPVTSVTMNHTQLALKQGEEVELIVTVAPSNATDQKIYWTSSQPTVAVVSEDGNVRAVSEGTAVITATASNGVYAACTVRVEKEQAQPEIPKEPESEKILVAYFSWSGTSERIAQNIIGQTGADSFRIERETPYSTDYNETAYGDAKEEADANARPPIKAPLDSVAQYDKIVLCYPIWWHTAPMTVGTFLESYDLSGKHIYPISQSASMSTTQYAQSVSFIRECAKDAIVDDGIFTKDNTQIENYVTDTVLQPVR